MNSTLPSAKRLLACSTPISLSQGNVSVVAGFYFYPGQSHSIDAQARFDDEGNVWLTDTDGKSLAHFSAAQVQHQPLIAGLPAELLFSDDSRFIPHDGNHRWPGQRPAQQSLEWLESHWLGVLSAVVAVPLFVWFMIVYGIPSMTHAGVEMMPRAIDEQVGQHTFSTLEYIYLEPSELSPDLQQGIRDEFEHLLTQLSLPVERYRLVFYDSMIGANALALPDGTIVVTDDLARMLQHQPQQLHAILLHEIGHVEHRHGMKKLAQTTATSFLFAMMFGDIEGMGEMIIGAGGSLLESAFSRDMEREADQFAHQHAQQAGLSAQDFADAMRALAEGHDINISQDGDWSDYLSTHPGMGERIREAEQAAASERQPDDN
ncbi:peptidase [Bacterioplanes sanyensis]|uniref:Peptidase n=1 Tax=Bacterioplanes sanyensis TaxID=1249553 RepID=A0A222FI81_9GAMM|nr:M48 family metallopeptidase [Bacterioplanes sanyensis]ASP38362.1 peptidase [Bacterioplanes sanyensis]